MSSCRRFVIIAGCVCAVVWALVTWLSHGIAGLAGFQYENSNDQMPTGLWLILHFVAGGILLVALIRLRGDRTRRSFRREKFNALALPIIGFAIGFRLILLFSVPIHESDFYRYVWDGQNSAAGINPYEFEPGALFLYENEITEWFGDRQVTGVIWKGRAFSSEEVERLEVLRALRDAQTQVLERVGHPAVPTIYPPLAQGVFWLSVVLFGPSILGLKIVLLIFELGIIALIYRLLQRFRMPPAGLLIYAWNPLVLKEFANSAHYDAVPIFFTILAVSLAVRKRRKGDVLTSGIGAAVALAAGTLAKFFSVLLLPILVPLRGRNWRAFAIFAAVVVLAFLPFFFWNGIGWQRVFAGLGIYNQHWQYNAFAFPLVHRALTLVLAVESDLAWTIARLIVAGTLLLIVGWLALRRPLSGRKVGPLRKVYHCGLCIGALFLLSPTAFPWYICWLLPFLCLFPRWPWILLSLLLPLNYLDFHSAASMPLVHQRLLGIPVVAWWTWGVFVAALAADFLLCESARRSRSGRL